MLLSHVRSLLSALVLIPTILSAQPAAEQSPDRAGRATLLFSLDGLGRFGIGGVAAGSVGTRAAGGDTSRLGARTLLPGIGVELPLPSRFALRGLLAGMYERVTEGESDPGFAPDAFYRTHAAAEISLLRYESIAPGIHPYAGGSVGASLAESGRTPGGIDSLTRSLRSTTISFGLIGGIAWEPVDRLRFGLQYRLGVDLTSESSHIGERQTAISRGTTLLTGAGAVLVGFVL